MPTSGELPSRPGEHPPSERQADIGLPKDQPATPPDDKAGEPKQTPRM